ncbi:TLC domain-containing protein [Colletotrichum scovillei]|uniref:TLC domain-containing protein n=1 Tax=Colletotrichum scovillei TaxID=1209932 RepID=A0A9P7RHG0_9PEZI|nr:TLC domain-containing protein [Colletotrichum scovillei]KAF4777794.1 TLC domain-containing protein [Colletotrichum scovillei]KAG7058608.1 TLC domain-containing protein [Colletotrichum scovillei]KAG7077291.1 TLC domain-containing protein [Colletotrichum scovillei]KAG7084294.1 TLC domain-containing protein [Colletotrichum scovillei]
MKDPFFLEPLPWLVKATQPFADYFSLPTLPIHIHEVLASALLYSVIYYPVSPLLSRLIVGRKYLDLPRKRRINWDAHVVSLVQSLLINGLALWVMFVDEERSTMDWQARMWGYTGAAGMIQGLAAGYFLWDLVVTSLNMDVFGLGTLAHAVSALFVFSLGFRPFLNYYGCIFILWELSTPFLNIHWFFDKLGMTGSRAQLYNGLMLLFTFFSCRLVYGTYQSVKVFSDIYAAINAHPVLPKEISPETGAVLAPTGVMRFATASSTVPTWLAVTYLMSNMTLNSLNFYWFIMMIRAVRKRFQPVKSTDKQATIEPSTAKATAASPATQARRRKA